MHRATLQRPQVEEEVLVLEQVVLLLVDQQVDRAGLEERVTPQRSAEIPRAREDLQADVALALLGVGRRTQARLGIGAPVFAVLQHQVAARYSLNG
jgi:hypothetical protein